MENLEIQGLGEICFVFLSVFFFPLKTKHMKGDLQLPLRHTSMGLLFSKSYSGGGDFLLRSHNMIYSFANTYRTFRNKCQIRLNAT